MLRLSIAIPDSSLIEESSSLKKVMKISQIARACSIFRVNTIYIYHEADGTKRDRSLLHTILKYLETPPYLRRVMYMKTDDLKLAGALNPLKIPSHVQTPDKSKIKRGDFRDGVVVIFKGRKYVDVGIDHLIPYYGSDEEGKRIVVQFKEGFPNLTIKKIMREEIKQYWGYDIKEISNLNNLVSTWKSFIIFTSRKGKPMHKSQKYLEGIGGSEVLLVFGSPRRGVHEILGKSLGNISRSQILNFFSNQGTETVRLEEAILGTLAILNAVI